VGFPTIFVEVDDGGLYPDRPSDVERYNWRFHRLQELSLSAEDSAELLSRVVREL
jgi:hypothetical protein